MNYDKIGEFIFLKRKEKGLTQNELAEKVGVTDKAVSKWERGLGCPDVSILDILAKELDVSVLEILKGRKMENTVIKITEADNYVKESFKVSEALTKNIIFDKISHFIFYLIIFISIIFICFTIKNYINLNNGEIIELNKSGVNEQISILEDRIDYIKSNKGILTDEEQKELVKQLGNLINQYKNNYLYNLKTDNKYTATDIMKYYIEDLYKNEELMSSDSSERFNLIYFMQVLRNHHISENLVSRSLYGMINYQAYVENDFVNYYMNLNQKYYNFKVSASFSEDFSRASFNDDSLNYYVSRMFDVNTKMLDTYNILLDELIKAGENNE